ncbi:MAG: SDR family oxidoreductase [Gemmatimonadetes bacterium]|uniref:SDR family oxidoreductase n=1 Tax=Candidatus Kutchimonas denitrificans TaxID=3056748 RepID=A0AAE4ZAH0_9BACT|nr:SDR family oxidoreductase [Gemmatimonadota bacterium]NIR75547.1 SDR family oxidoreductase [Candidatus Kutchimonas denitrificans]NIS01861.1 SDR family oxidoreductase [Gemmatimonadota bacterium]NIT67642.1 SDR family oxidoreductase [Gemmatimonadota bacterium]NIU53516.1 SDR family oxidoreductase [Gemmatimonadota bacterium]
MDLDGRTALVTGAARRLGREIATALADAGSAVAVHHHASAGLARDVVADLHGRGVHADVFQADLTDPARIVALFAEVEAALGPIDVLVNNAAIFQQKPVLDITPEDWDAVLDLNLKAPFFCSQQAATQMDVRGGVIINIADIAAYQAWPGYAHHCVSKAGIVAMTRVLARALAPRIRVNAVAPGSVLPPDELDRAGREELAEMTALKRLGAPEDVSRAVLFLVESDYITGETVVVDGGKMLRS